MSTRLNGPIAIGDEVVCAWEMLEGYSSLMEARASVIAVMEASR